MSLSKNKNKNELNSLEIIKKIIEVKIENNHGLINRDKNDKSILNDLKILKDYRIGKLRGYDVQKWKIQPDNINYLSSLLKNEMLKLGFIYGFIDLMFISHSDIDLRIDLDEWVLKKLSENLDNENPIYLFYKESIKLCLDLILNWVGIRLQFYNFKNNFRFLYKCFPYLNKIFDFLKSSINQILNEFEFGYFLSAFYEIFTINFESFEIVKNHLEDLSDKIIRICDFFTVFRCVQNVLHQKNISNAYFCLGELLRITNLNNFLNLNFQKQAYILETFAKISSSLVGDSLKNIFDSMIFDFIIQIPSDLLKFLSEHLDKDNLSTVLDILNKMNSLINRKTSLSLENRLEIKKKEFKSLIEALNREEIGENFQLISKKMIEFIDLNREMIEIQIYDDLLLCCCIKLHNSVFEIELSWKNKSRNQICYEVFECLVELIYKATKKKLDLNIRNLEKCFNFLFAIYQLKKEGFFKKTNDDRIFVLPIINRILSSVGLIRGISVFLRMLEHRYLIKRTLDFENKKDYLEKIKNYLKSVHLISDYVVLSDRDASLYKRDNRIFEFQISVSIDFIQKILRMHLDEIFYFIRNNRSFLKEYHSDIFEIFIPRAIKFNNSLRLNKSLKKQADLCDIHARISKIFYFIKEKYPHKIKYDF
ncbi:unnamed protein product [Brachionus calyciflorus]|uniref:Uncharacterized protein n=1 Tax=Brachionus calyciflorus TaxID=104777 RepID=A0A813MA80_9BILA|nr:unnamed protein product [Brachionus calyciflorus]